MQKIAAELRHRELTQEIYNIGDEVAEYTEHLAEAIADYDGELTEDCLAEFVEIVDDARHDARRVVAELIGLRQALTSGRAAGYLSVGVKPEERIPEPELLDASGLNDLYPLQAPFSVQTMQDALTGRTAVVAGLTPALDPLDDDRGCALARLACHDRPRHHVEGQL